MEYTVNACDAISIDVSAGQKISIVDIDGGQVADFFAECENVRIVYMAPVLSQVGCYGVGSRIFCEECDFRRIRLHYNF